MLFRSVEKILGFTKKGDKLSINPVIPKKWNSFSITYHYEQSRYDITVENPKGKQSGVTQVTLDGKVMATNKIPLVKNSSKHIVTVVM